MAGGQASSVVIIDVSEGTAGGVGSLGKSSKSIPEVRRVIFIFSPRSHKPPWCITLQMGSR